MSNKSIFYIMSDVRSGSTLLENLLSKSPSVISVGEFSHFKGHIEKKGSGKLWGWKCSCGKEILECPFWKKVVDRYKKNGGPNTFSTKMDFKYSAFQLMKREPFILKSEKNEKIFPVLQKFYEAIFFTNDNDIIVDSSKYPLRGYCLYKKNKIPTKIIYLKRDIRAVSLSKKKWIKRIYNKDKNLYNILFYCKVYDFKCRRVYKMVDDCDKIKITYEELAKDPQKTVNKVLKKFGYKTFKVPQYTYLNNDHTIGGSPNRFDKQRIKYDEKWKDKMKHTPFFRFIGKMIDAN